ncbi:MAG TPA: hypothetical protein VHU86_04475 [Solirubrobacterales bacterium]|nr:hypothetical protein [Solirubrobacterales bacterium]
MELRCPECASPELAAAEPPLDLRCRNCGLAFRRAEAFVRLGEAEAAASYAPSLEEALHDLASELPTEEEWRRAADFMRHASEVLDRLGIERPRRHESSE